jgi:two-component system sensor histidine kinase EvgS
MTTIDLKNRQILVVEDEEMNWYLLRDIIALNQGFALWADSGMKALDLIRQNNSIELVLIDLKLPFMSGSETTAKIKQIRPELPIIAQTAISDPEILAKAIQAGCDSYILKPIELAQLNKIFMTYFK